MTNINSSLLCLIPAIPSLKFAQVHFARGLDSIGEAHGRVVFRQSFFDAKFANDF